MDVLLFLLQQLGVMLGVGAQTVLLVNYLSSVRVGARPTPTSFVRSTRGLLGISLFVIIGSGAMVTAMHFSAGSFDILFAPAFLFKWALILLALVLYLLAELPSSNSTHEALIEYLAGGTWFALFLVHSVAPVVAWSDLIILYVSWMVSFGVVWGLIVWALHKHMGVALKMPTLPKMSMPKLSMSAISIPKITLPKVSLPALPKIPEKPAPVVVSAPPPPPPPPKPLVIAPIKTEGAVSTEPRSADAKRTMRSGVDTAPGVLAIQPLELEAPVMRAPEPKPAAAPAPKLIEQIESLIPALRVMPRTPEDVARYHELAAKLAALN
ncbi:MAG: hypothetical protein KGI70_01740 [Patescibacteria group bacterium]|nr:hypothetical protein [Patescibacteria group bacterium]